MKTWWRLGIWGFSINLLCIGMPIAIGGFHQRRRRPIYIDYVYFEQIIVKVPKLSRLGWFLYEIGIEGWQMRIKISSTGFKVKIDCCIVQNLCTLKVYAYTILIYILLILQDNYVLNGRFLEWVHIDFSCNCYFWNWFVSICVYWSFQRCHWLTETTYFAHYWTWYVPSVCLSPKRIVTDGCIFLTSVSASI